jgi:hypothetical protein
MSTTKPDNIQLVCQVPGCKEGASMESIHGGTATYMRTCKRHTYQDLPEEKQKIETFWPPENK